MITFYEERTTADGLTYALGHSRPIEPFEALRRLFAELSCTNAKIMRIVPREVVIEVPLFVQTDVVSFSSDIGCDMEYIYRGAAIIAHMSRRFMPATDHSMGIINRNDEDAIRTLGIALPNRKIIARHSLCILFGVERYTPAYTHAMFMETDDLIAAFQMAHEEMISPTQALAILTS
jgi:hypothetical protein